MLAGINKVVFFIRHAAHVRQTNKTVIHRAREAHERYQNDPSAFTRYYISFYSGAYLGVISEWIDSGMTETSEEMALISMRLLFIKPGESIKM